MLNRGELVTEVASNLNRDDLDTRIILWLDLAQLEIAKSHNWLSLRSTSTLTTTADTKQLSLSSDTLKVLSLRRKPLGSGTGGAYLDHVFYVQGDKARPWPDTQSTGRPVYYQHASLTVVELMPVPGDAYEVLERYIKRPARFTSDSIEPEIEDIDDALINTATARGFFATQEHEQARYWQTLGRQSIERAVNEDTENIDWRQSEWQERGTISQTDVVDRVSSPFYGI